VIAQGAREALFPGWSSAALTIATAQECASRTNPPKIHYGRDGRYAEGFRREQCPDTDMSQTRDMDDVGTLCLKPFSDPYFGIPVDGGWASGWIRVQRKIWIDYRSDFTLVFFSLGIARQVDDIVTLARQLGS